MNETRKFLTTAEMIQKKHSGWSGGKCETCKKGVANEQHSYSMRFYSKPLCRSCQSPEHYQIKLTKTYKT